MAASGPAGTPITAVGNRRGIRRLFVAYRIEILLLLIVVAVVGPLVHDYRAQQASRYLFSAAIWDMQQFELDQYAAIDPPVLGRDRAVKDGHTYSDKAPLQPLLAVPLYGVYRGIGGEPATERRIERNLGLWWLTLWMATIPTALLAVIVFRFVSRHAEARTALIASLAFAFGSLALPFGALLFGHALAALLGFSSFHVLSSNRPTNGRLFLAGALVGLAVATDYPAVILVPIFSAYAVWRFRSRTVLFLLGGSPGLLLLAWYHTVVFGSPLTHPYRWSAFAGVQTEAQPLTTMFDAFQVQNLFEVFFHGRGFVMATPIVILGLLGLVAMIRAKAQWEVGLVGLTVFLVFLMIPLFWGQPWGGDSPGARYMLPALPFVAPGVAYVWTRSGRIGRFCLGVSVVTMVAATFTNPILARESARGLDIWVAQAIQDGLTDTVFTIAMGPIGWLVQLVLVVAVWRLLMRYLRDQEGVAIGASAQGP